MTFSGPDLETVPTSYQHVNTGYVKIGAKFCLHIQYYTIVIVSKGFGLLVTSSLFILRSLLSSDTLLTK